MLVFCSVQLMSANQRLYQAEQTSATAVANAAQLQGEVLRLSNQMDGLRLDLETQGTLADNQQVDAAIKHKPCLLTYIILQLNISTVCCQSSLCH